MWLSATYETLMKDMSYGDEGVSISAPTLKRYMDELKSLYLIDDLEDGNLLFVQNLEFARSRNVISWIRRCRARYWGRLRLSLRVTRKRWEICLKHW